MSTVQHLIFRVSNLETIKFEVNHETKLVKQLYVEDERAARIILLEKERTYDGIEKRLNFYMATDYTLLEMIEVIKAGEFQADFQHNLYIIVEDIC